MGRARPLEVLRARPRAATPLWPFPADTTVVVLVRPADLVDADGLADTLAPWL